MPTKKKQNSNAWKDDGDDLHFPGNPAVRKRHSKKHLIGAGTKSNGHPNVAYPKGRMTRTSGNGKTTGGRKRSRKRAIGK